MTTDQPTGDDVARYAEAEAWRRRVEAGLDDDGAPECEICGAAIDAENWPDGPAPWCRACELEVDTRILADERAGA